MTVMREAAFFEVSFTIEGQEDPEVLVVCPIGTGFEDALKFASRVLFRRHQFVSVVTAVGIKYLGELTLESNTASEE